MNLQSVSPDRMTTDAFLASIRPDQIKLACLKYGCTFSEPLTKRQVDVLCHHKPSHPGFHKLYVVDGVEGTITDHCRKTGLSVSLVSGRLIRGWPVDRAFKEPAHPPGNRFTKKPLTAETAGIQS